MSNSLTIHTSTPTIPAKTSTPGFKSFFKNILPGFSKTQQINVQEHITPLSYDQIIRTKLKAAVWNEDEASISHLLANGVDINSKDASGSTLFDAALRAKNLAACRFLIDHGASPNENNITDLTTQLEAQGLKKNQLSSFMVQRPARGKLEIFVNNKFVSLPMFLKNQLDDSKPLTKPIAIFNVADESFTDSYGAVIKMFNPKDSSISALYKEAAQHFTVLRVFVTDPNQLVSIAKEAKLATKLPIHHWSLNGHGSETQLEMRTNRYFSIDDEPTMQALAAEMAPECTIALSGCSTAEGARNITSVFSKYTGQRPVCGAPTSFYQVDPSFVATDEQHTGFIPYFISKDNPSEKYVRIYKEGAEVTEKGWGDLSYEPNLGHGKKMWEDD